MIRQLLRFLPLVFAIGGLVVGFARYGDPAYTLALAVWAAGTVAIALFTFAAGLRLGWARAWYACAVADWLADRSIARGHVAARTSHHHRQEKS